MTPFNKRHALGQHFLRDESIANTIANTAIQEAKGHGCKNILEIGPGHGAITNPLLDILSRTGQETELLLCELDHALALRWRDKVSGPLSYENVKISVEEGDFLALPQERWLANTPLAVVSNLPYSSGTRIMTSLARFPNKIPFMLLMFQAEVAERLSSEPGTKNCGSLSIWLQNRWEVIKQISVPPNAFAPPPKVQSEVVLLRAMPAPRIIIGDNPQAEALWEKLLKVCFAHRRKMLRSSLPSSGHWREAFVASGIDGTKRPEALGWKEWEIFYSKLIELSLPAATV